MQPRVSAIIFLAVLSLIAAFILRHVIYALVIIPLAYIWWVIGLYYRLLPQAVTWAFLIIMILVTALRGLLTNAPTARTIKVTKKQSQGPIETLSIVVGKNKRGNYYKWLVAHRLGKIARDLLEQREGRSNKPKYAHLSGRDWNPSKEVDAYLESGLNGSFADFPYLGWGRRRQTPLDVNPQIVVEYLESEMENNRNGHR